MLQLPAPFLVLELFIWHLTGRALLERLSLTPKLFWYHGATWASQNCTQSRSGGAAGVKVKTEEKRKQRGVRDF